MRHKEGAPADSFCLLGLDMHAIKDALILCSSLKQPADHIGRIKPLWQHPIHPSMTLEAQSIVFAEQRFCAKRVTGMEMLPVPSLQCQITTTGKCSMHLFRCHQRRSLFH